jgi:hypothetical protein
MATSVFLLLLTMAPASAAAEDLHWPHEISKPGGKLVVYQPQVDDWENFQQLDAGSERVYSGAERGAPRLRLQILGLGAVSEKLIA